MCCFGCKRYSPALMTHWTDWPWTLALLRGLLGTALFVLLFLAARYRWTERETRDGAADIGLD